MQEVKLLTADQLRFCIKSAFKPFDICEEHVGWVAECLISTSLNGVDTHGVSLLKTYVDEIGSGVSNPKPDFKYHNYYPAIVNMDADGALGIVSATKATEEAIKTAKDNGVGVVSVKNSNHFGAAGHYTALAAKEDMLGVCFSNSDALVAAFNGVEKLNGTNPLSFAISGLNDDLFLFDMATSQVSFSYLRKLLQENGKVPEGNAIDTNGRDISLGGELHALLGLGGYKGQGLGMMVQLLTAVLSHSPFDYELEHLFDASNTNPRQISHFILCVELSSFGKVAVVKEKVSSLLSRFRNSKAVGSVPVLVPGDKERESRRRRLRTGIPVSQTEYNYFSTLLK